MNPAVAKAKEPFNPFYAILLVAGILFAITACAYGVMAFKALGASPTMEESSSATGLLVFLDRHGALLLTVELLALGIATAGVIGWDQWASARIASAEKTPDALHVNADPTLDGPTISRETGEQS